MRLPVPDITTGSPTPSQSCRFDIRVDTFRVTDGLFCEAILSISLRDASHFILVEFILAKTRATARIDHAAWVGPHLRGDDNINVSATQFVATHHRVITPLLRGIRDEYFAMLERA